MVNGLRRNKETPMRCEICNVERMLLLRVTLKVPALGEHYTKYASVCLSCAGIKDKLSGGSVDDVVHPHRPL